MTLRLNHSQKIYLERSLQAVSRSFAIVIPCLEEPLQFEMGVAYLLCRVVDNIEDCQQSFSWKQKRFSEFRQLLENPGNAEKSLQTWEAEEWSGLSEDEYRLITLEGGLDLWNIFELIDSPSRDVICQWCTEMANGMEEIVQPNPRKICPNGRAIDFPKQLS